MSMFQNLEQRVAHSARKWLPANTVGWLKRQRDGWRMRRRQQLRAQLIAKHGTFTAAQLVEACRAAGIREGGILFVQCSLNGLLTYGGTPYELLLALHELVGPRGTLLMPAFTTNMGTTPCRPFDVLREPTYTGLIPELFRREVGVVRSLHPRHSICGSGPLAQELLAGHEDCVYADGLGSPFDRIRKMEAQSLCLAMRPGWHSFLHWVEDIEPEKFPVQAHEGPYECVIRDAKGEELRRPFYRCTDNRINQDHLIGKNLGASALRTQDFYGIPLCFYSWPALATELLALRDRGILWFVPAGRNKAWKR